MCDCVKKVNAALMEGENSGARPVKTEIPDGEIKRNIEMLKKHGFMMIHYLPGLSPSPWPILSSP